MNTRRLWPILLATALALGSCGGDDSGSSGIDSSNSTSNSTSSNGASDAGDDDASDASEGDGSGGGDGGEADADDVEGDADTGPPPTQETGDPCEEDAQCVSGFCLFVGDNIDQGFCSDFCGDASDCPDAETYDCVPFANSGSDRQSLCVPTDICIDADEDGYGFGPGCEDRDCDDDDPDINPGISEIIEVCMAKKKDKRYNSSTDLLEDLIIIKKV